MTMKDLSKRTNEGLKKTIDKANKKKEPSLDNITRQHSRFTDRELRREKFTNEQIGYLRSIGELKSVGVEDGEVYYTTQKMIDLEREIIATANKRATEREHQVRSIIDDGLSDEQSNALRHITQNSGGIACIEGMAGTGKTTMLNKTRETYENSGYEMYGCALAGKAAKGLQEGSQIPSSTIHSLVYNLNRDEKDEKRIELTRKSVVVVDEAGMVPSHLMASLSQHVNKAGAKMVLVGDDRQLQPIEAGGIFGKLKEDLGAARLTTIYRQKEEWMRDAVHNFADGNAKEGLQKYRDAGLFKTEKDDIQTKFAVAEAWNAKRDEDCKNSLIITDLKRNAIELNTIARTMRNGQGELGASAVLSGTKNMEFAVNDRIVFTSNSREFDVKNGELATVIAVDGENNRFAAVKDDGGKVNIPFGEYSSVDYGYALTVHKSQGVTVDNCYVLAGPMFDREMSYVAMSRHREECKLFADGSRTSFNDLAQQMSVSHKKGTALDFEQNTVNEFHDEIENSYSDVADDVVAVAKEEDIKKAEDIKIMGLFNEHPYGDELTDPFYTDERQARNEEVAAYFEDQAEAVDEAEEEIELEMKTDHFNGYGIGTNFGSEAEKRYFEATEMTVIDGVAVQVNKLTGKPWTETGPDSYEEYLRATSEGARQRAEKIIMEEPKQYPKEIEPVEPEKERKAPVDLIEPPEPDYSDNDLFAIVPPETTPEEIELYFGDEPAIQPETITETGEINIEPEQTPDIEPEQTPDIDPYYHDFEPEKLSLKEELDMFSLDEPNDIYDIEPPKEPPKSQLEQELDMFHIDEPMPIVDEEENTNDNELSKGVKK